MSFTLTPDEQALIARIPERDLTEMAVDLDLLLPEDVDRQALVTRCLEAILERAADDGIPLSKYDADDLKALPEPHLQALGRAVGLRGRVTVRAMLKAGAKTWKQFRKHRPNSATALLIPTLLAPLARAAHERDGA